MIEEGESQKKKTRIGNSYLPEAERLLEAELAPKQDDDHTVCKDAVPGTDRRQVLIKLGVTFLQDGSNAVQLAANALLVNAKVVFRRPHKPGSETRLRSDDLLLWNARHGHHRLNRLDTKLRSL